MNLIYPSNACMVNGDATRILQLLMNLTLNSRDAMPNGGALQVEVKAISGNAAGLTTEPEQSEWIRLKVTDDGVGIAPEVLPHIFEPFFTTKSHDKGTGLGLAQVYGIVQQHKGYIQVESQPRQGTSFSIFLPSPTSATVPKSGPGNQQLVVAPGLEQTILVVEDDEDARDSLRELLESMNYRILTASNGREALETLDRAGNDVDLILTDMVMPEMGGLDLCRAIRHRSNQVKIISMTGYAAPETRAELGELNLSGHLQKPIDAEQLSRCIKGALQIQATCDGSSFK